MGQPNHSSPTLTAIFAGPFCGEFGWELFGFQGYLRAMSDRTEQNIVVCSRPGHEALYEDFAAGYVAFTPPDKQPDVFRMHGIKPDAFRNVVPEGFQWLNPVTDIPSDWRKGCPVVHDQRFIPFGKTVLKSQKRYDILIHARNRNRSWTREDRNWPHEKWMELLSTLSSEMRVGWIGTKAEAMARGGPDEDLRGLSLKKLIEVMSHSHLVIGPSSGPMHLASLCRVPHVVWSGNARDVIRYRERWNPFAVSHSMIRTWQPEVVAVRDQIGAFLGC